MSEFLIDGKVLTDIADKIRENLSKGLSIGSADSSSNGKLEVGSVIVHYREFVDAEGTEEDGTYCGFDDGSLHSDQFIAYGYLKNNEGKIVPVIYDTDLNSYSGPDYAEPFFYVGTVQIDGVSYNRWRKIETGDNAFYTWDNSEQQYVYTNVIVRESEEIYPTDMPSKVDEVFGVGQTMGHIAGYREGLEDAIIEVEELPSVWDANKNSLYKCGDSYYKAPKVFQELYCYIDGSGAETYKEAHLAPDYVCSFHYLKSLPESFPEFPPGEYHFYFIESDNSVYVGDGQISMLKRPVSVVSSVGEIPNAEDPDTVYALIVDGWENYIFTNGTKKLVSNGSYDVSGYEEAVVALPVYDGNTQKDDGTTTIKGVWEFNSIIKHPGGYFDRSEKFPDQKVNFVLGDGTTGIELRYYIKFKQDSWGGSSGWAWYLESVTGYDEWGNSIYRDLCQFEQVSRYDESLRCEWFFSPRTIDFGEVQEVSTEFYKWMRKNAVPVSGLDYRTLEGTWKFNDKLTAPGSDLLQDINFTTRLCSLNRDALVKCSGFNVLPTGSDRGELSIEYRAVSATDDIEQLEITLPRNINVYNQHHASSWTWSDKSKVQTIVFEYPQEVSNEFYDWFTANASQPSTVVDVIYNGKTVNSLRSGENLYLTCEGYVSEGDIEVKVAQLEEKPLLQETTIIRNGYVSPDEGYGGFGQLLVNVPPAESTPLPAGEMAGTIYFNTWQDQTVTAEILSKLTYVQTEFLEYPISLIYACVDENMQGHFIYAVNAIMGWFDPGFHIFYSKDLADSNSEKVQLFTSLYSEAGVRNEGWSRQLIGNMYEWGVINSNSISLLSGDMGQINNVLTAFHGYPVGAENNKLKDVFSITPFVSASRDSQVDLLLQKKYAVADGEYTPDAGYDGLSKVIVDTPPSLSVEGQAVPVNKEVKRIYFNTNNTVRQTNNLLSQLTYIDAGFGFPVSFLYADTLDGNQGVFIGAVKESESSYYIMLLTDLTTLEGVELFSSRGQYEQGYYNGWNRAYEFVNGGLRCDIAIDSIGVHGSSLGELMGIPVGAENEKIKNVLSSAPFAAFPDKVVAEGTAIPADQVVDRIYFNTHKTIEETNKVLSQLTYVQTGLYDYPVSLIFAHVDPNGNGYTGKFVFVVHAGSTYGINYCSDVLNQSYESLYLSGIDDDPRYLNGWCPGINSEEAVHSIVKFLDMQVSGITEWNGIPVGVDNEKIKSVLSITPFINTFEGSDVKLHDKVITENGEYLPNDGYDGIEKIIVDVQPILGEPTAISPTARFDKVYFNNHISIHRAKALLSQLTYVQTDLFDFPISFIYTRVNAELHGNIIFAACSNDPIAGKQYGIIHTTSFTTGRFKNLFSSYPSDNTDNGWYAEWIRETENGGYYGEWSGLTYGALRLTEEFLEERNCYPVTEFNGYPVGDDNEKIKDILSLTPFVNKSEGTGSEVILQDKTVTSNGTVKADEGFDGLGEVSVKVPIPRTEGTAIPTGVEIDRIYFNTVNSTEETDKLLSQLTYIEGVFENPTAFIYADTTDGNTGNFIGVWKYDDTHYGIGLINNLSSMNGVIIYATPGSTGVSDLYFYNGWTKSTEFVFADGYDLAVGSISLPGSSLSEFMGFPVGAENELIKNVLSITPFAVVSPKGDPEGTSVSSGFVEKVYFNINNTMEETNEILSQLTYVQTPFLRNPIYPIFAWSDPNGNGYTGKFIFVVKNGAYYEINYCDDISTSSFVYLYVSYGDSYNGWSYCDTIGSSTATGVPAFIELDVAGASDWGGLTVGAENDKLKNVLSLTPFAVKGDDRYDEGVEAGKKAEYDKFWDIHQEYGNRHGYNYAFSYGWTNENFKPKYDLRPIGDYGANQMFAFSQAGLDVAAGLAYNGVSLDLSQATRWNALFDRANVTNIPPLDAKSCTQMQMAFYNATAITSLTINNIREDCTFDRTFNYMYGLTDLNITGVIGDNISFLGCIKLSKASIAGIIDALSTTKSGCSLTLNTTAVANAFGSTAADEWTALKGTRPNWTITLTDAL